MNRAPSEQKALQRRGAIAALVLAAGSLGTVGFFIARGALRPPARAEAEIQDVGITIRPGQDLTPGSPAGGDQIRIKLIDKKDPGRRAGIMIVDSMDPLQGHQYSVTKPDAWLYPKDGGAIRIQAAHGRLYMPDGQN